MKEYMYVAIRRDLTIPQQVVQSVHAAIEASEYLHKSADQHPSVVVLGVKTEKALQGFKEFAQKENFDFKEFREPDRNNELTSVAVYPVDENQKKAFKRYQLLK